MTTIDFYNGKNYQHYMVTVQERSGDFEYPTTCIVKFNTKRYDENRK